MADFNKEETSSKFEFNYHYRENIACVWMDDVGDKTNWHLGIVDNYENRVNYFYQTSKELIKMDFISERSRNKFNSS